MTVRPPDPPVHDGERAVRENQRPLGADRPVSATRTAPGSSVTRVTLVDDHDIVRQGLRVLLRSEDDITVVAEAGTVADAIAVTRAVESDVVVMDVRLVEGSGVVASRAIRSEHPAVVVILLTSLSDDEALFQSIMAGAAGYVLKQVRGNALVRAIRRAAAGGSLLDPARTAATLARLRVHDGDAFRAVWLTPAQRRIVELIAQGATDCQIAERLDLTEQAVATEIAAMVSAPDSGRRAAMAAILADHLVPALPAAAHRSPSHA